MQLGEGCWSSSTSGNSFIKIVEADFIVRDFEGKNTWRIKYILRDCLHLYINFNGRLISLDPSFDNMNQQHTLKKMNFFGNTTTE